MMAIEWNGHPLPMVVRVAVYRAAQVAALGVRSTDPAVFTSLLARADFERGFPDILRQQIHAEMRRHGIDTGVDEAAIEEAIAATMHALRAGSVETVSRKIAAGELPEDGTDSRFEYILNPDGLALADLGQEEQRRMRARVHQVDQGQRLVVRHPPADARPGITVTGESVPPRAQGHDESLLVIAGPNTEVQDKNLVATIAGVYREDERGHVRVVQELEVDEVNAVTGDLPHAGVAAVNVLVRRGVAAGAAIQTTEDVFVGAVGEAGTLEAGSRLRAGNLCVRGLAVGGGVPEAYLAGELAALEQSEQAKIRSELSASLVEVDEVLAVRELIGRSVTAGTVLVQTNAHGAAIEAAGDVQVDGDLVGGLVSCGGRVEVLADMGNEVGTPTRVRLELEGPQAKRRRRLEEELSAQSHRLNRLLGALDEHRKGMEARARKSPYWDALMRGDKRPPSRPIERRLLSQFLQSARQGKRMTQEVDDARTHQQGLEALLADMTARAGHTETGVRVLVGGTVHPGVSLEMMRPLDPADAERTVTDRTGKETTIAAVTARLAAQVERYVSLYEESVEERKEALDRMFEGREARPAAPKVPDRKFEEVVSLPQESQRAGDPLRRQAAVQVHAHDPAGFYLKQMASVTEPVANAAVALEQVEGRLEFTCAAGEGAPTSWQQDESMLSVLEEIRVLGVSARRHLID